MAIGIYAASISVYQRQPGAISKILEKGSAWAAAKKVDEAVLGATRLIPHMLPLSRQVQIACRVAEESAARLAGVEMSKTPENAEKTLGELRARIAAVLAYLKGIKLEQVDGSEGREVVLTIAGNLLKLTGERYLLHFAMPTSISIARPPTQSCVSAVPKSGNAISSVASRKACAQGAPCHRTWLGRAGVYNGSPTRRPHTHELREPPFFHPRFGGWHADTGSAYVR